MTELAADGIPVAVTCRVLNIARQPYYRWRARPVTETELERAHWANALFDAHRDDPEFGYRFLADEGGKIGRAVFAGKHPIAGVGPAIEVVSGFAHGDASAPSPAPVRRVPSFARAAARRQSRDGWQKGREAGTVTRSVLVRAASFRT